MGTNIPVCFMPAAVDACAFYRMYIPHLSFSGSDYYFTGWKDRTTPNEMDIHRLIGKKVAVVQRQSTIHNLNAMKNMHALGIKVIYDLDDNLWNLPHGNPAKWHFEQFQDGFAMCAKEADVLTVSTQGLRAAASVAFHAPREKILIVPNAVDCALFRPKQIERDDGYVLIGWGGSNTHTEDVRYVFDLLPDILNENPHAMMEIVGAPPKYERVQEVKVLELKHKEEPVHEGSKELKQVPDYYVCQDLKTKSEFNLSWVQLNRRIQVRTPVGKGKFRMTEKEIPVEECVGQIFNRLVLDDSKLAFHDRYRFKPWAPIREYANRYASWSWDIAIAPLDENRFNNSKSNIKMLEAAALKIPCLVSNVTPYIEFCSLGGPELTWLLCHNIEDWRVKLTRLINDPELRQKLGQKMFETMKKFYDMEVVKDNWMHAFQTALKY